MHSITRAGMIWSLFIAFSIAFPTHAKNAIQLPKEDSLVSPLQGTRVLFDKHGKLGVEEVIDLKNTFESIDHGKIDFGPRKGKIWLHFTVKNISSNNNMWVLDFKRQHLKKANAYLLYSGKEPEQILNLEQNNRFTDRPIANRYIVTPFELEPEDRADIFIGYASETTTSLPLTISQSHRFLENNTRSENFNWLSNGIQLATVLATIIFGRAIGWPLAISFAAFTASGLAFSANNRGTLMAWLYPDNPELFDKLLFGLFILTSISGVIFLRQFFDSWKNFPVSDRWLKWSLLAMTISAIIAVIFYPVEWAFYPAVILISIVSIFCSIILIRSCLEGHPGAVPLLLGNLLAFCILLYAIYTILVPGMVTPTSALEYSQYALLAESFLFGLAVIYRLLGMQQAYNLALIQELETSREKLRLSETLDETKFQYDQIENSTGRDPVTETLNDFKQPLATLRSKLAELSTENSNESATLTDTIEYLEQLVDVEPEESIAIKRDSRRTGSCEQRTFPVATIIEKGCEMFEAEAGQQGISLKQSSVALDVKTDPVALQRMVNNLVANAIKHSGGATIWLSAKAGSNDVIIEVSDDGRGMTEEQIRKATTAYVKGRKSHGSGLGLYLTKTLAKELGIGFSIQSTIGKGCCFSLTLPEQTRFK